MDHYLRIGYGDSAGHLREGLSRLDNLLRRAEVVKA
jgi:hypothetical protein